MYLTRTFLNKLFRLGLLFVIALLLADLLTYFYYPDSSLSEIFLATREQTPLTWVSAVVLLLIGFSCATAYINTKKPIWYLLSVVYFYFSIDDATYFHERFSGFLQDRVDLLASFPSYGWVLIYFPLLLFGLFSLVILNWKRADGKDKKIITLAVLGLFIALSLDMVDGWIGRDPVLVFSVDAYKNSVTEHLFRLTEETLEVLSFGLLGYLNIRNNSLLKEK